MRRLLIGLALASVAATPALARVQSQANHAGNLYLYSDAMPGAQNPAPGADVGPPGLKRRGYMMTDPDPLIRLQIQRGYSQGSTD